MTDHPDIIVERLERPDGADQEAVLRLEAASFAYRSSAAAFDGMISGPASRVYVARDRDRRIIAFCACWVVAAELHINTIAVDPDHRRRGVASRVLRHMLLETGVRRATLEVRRSNVAALGLYQRLGFTVTAVREGYYENPPEDALILWLNP